MRPVFRALSFSVPDLFPRNTILFALFASLALFFLTSPSFALDPPFYAGSTQMVYGTIVNGAGDLGANNPYHTWRLAGPSTYATTSAPSGWTVLFSGPNGLKITAPSTAALGSYTVSFASKQTPYQGELMYSGPQVTFQIISPPPTLPPAGMPAFSWQGSVAGVNTGNGNKTTTVPIVGWTMRGGMGVSCALIHNSQGSATGIPGTYGAKWQASYESYLTADGSGNETVHWDTGISYTFTKSGTAFTAPYGIFDTLTANGSSGFILTRYDQTKLTFGFSAASNWYLSKITDLDNNTLTINHNANGSLSTVVDPTGRALTYTYDGTGRLSTVKDPLNRVWTLTYDGAAGTGNLWYVTLPALSGSNYSQWFGYDANHNITGQQSPQGHTTAATSTFGYNSNNSLAWAKDPLGNQTTFTYNPTTTVITDPNGHTTTHTYNASQLVAVTDALGKTASTSYDYNNIASNTTDKRGYVSTFSSHFTNNSSTSTSTDPFGNASSSTIDPTKANKTVSSVDPIGNSTAYTYSATPLFDLLSTQITGTGSAPFHSLSSVSGYTNGLPSTVTDAYSYNTTLAYDPNGYPNSSVDANNNPTSATYNALGWKLTSTDGNGHTITSTYDNWGRVTDVMAPDATHTTSLYDLDGNALRVSDANATSLTLSGSAAWGTGLTGSALSFNGTAGAASASNTTLGNFGTGDFSISVWVKYTGAGGYFLYKRPNLDNHCSFFGLVLSTAFGFELDQDGAGTNYLGLWGTHTINNGVWHHLVVVRTGATVTLYVDGIQDAQSTGPGTANISGNSALTISGDYHAYYSGLVDEVRVYNRALSASEISSLASQNPAPSTANQLLSYWKYSEGSGTLAYDSCHSVVNTYDVDDRLLATTNGRGDTVTYAYDGTDPVSGAAQKGLLSSKTDGNGHVTRYRYTARNEPWATLYADGNAESVAYDENGNTTSRTKADGSVIAYTYDADNRLTDITYPHMAATHFDYDADGRKTHMHDSTGDTYWTYSDGVHLTQVTSPQGAVIYAYDSDGRRTTLTATGIGSWTTTFDPGGRVTSTKNPYNETTTLSYDAANRLIQKTKGNLNYEIYAYDVADQTTSIGYWWAGGILDRSLIYTYDPAGNVQSRNEGNRLINYSYDGADQLTAEVTTGAVPITIGYTYDNNGNRLTQTQNGSPYQSFTYDAHDKLTSGTGGNETDGYDANGNETSVSISGGLYTQYYDDEDRMTRITSSGGVNDTFVYNGLGLRVGKTDSTGTYSYLCDGTSPGSSVLSDGAAVYTPGQSERRGGASSYPDFDSLGNILTIDAASGNVTQAGYLVTGFGTPLYTTGSSPTPFKYGGANGCQTDNDTGLILMGHRYYDTRIGRFISQDPAGDGDNWYAYCDNSPVNGVDPEGLMPAGSGFGVMESLLVGATTAAQAMRYTDPTLNQLDALAGKFQYYNVWKVTKIAATGKVINTTYLFSFAIPIGTSIWGNYFAARNYAATHHASFLARGLGAIGVGFQIRDKVGDAVYVTNHFKNNTVGDFKDKNFPGLGKPRPGSILYQLADNGGNMNGGMGMQGLGMGSDEISLSGTVHRTMMAGHYEPDDAQGARILQYGYQYGTQFP